MTDSYKTPLGKVRGLGAAGGVHHFVTQRVSAIALVFLVPWFLISLLCAISGDNAADRYVSAASWVAQPLNAVLLVLTLGAMTYHMRLGMQVVIEDYIPGHGLRILLLLLNTFVSIALFAVAAFAILKIAG